MVNIEDFIKRLETILEYYGLSASSFADKIGVQRSSMSHLLSGRNKPSLDFVLKIIEVFPDIDLYWVLNGKGSFPKNENDEVVINSIPQEIEQPVAPIFPNNNFIPEDLFLEIEKPNEKNEKKIIEENAPEIKNTISNTSSGEIEKIVLFYKNGTFKAYTP
ncbi:helix-turn-helix transcriptional regulator [Flavobacterium branchiarum]|uniref:Helix-turn-helix domain-containing protein n=1 Tax=Flavobacterium branchiarum TaxID=1114870 RepID=A0ABV5FFU2_9FLAO|nr:helix-turn-helix transcriptional regulator [Flavobacterium branchiarum]MDN3673546.1 helix-turn-helix transcriptional regulator [Flavobacterium branchiarum]